jgi:hypothetical protein
MKILLLIFSLVLVVFGIVILSITYSDYDFNTSGKYILGGVVLGMGGIILAISIYLFWKRRKNTTFCGNENYLPNGYKTFGTNYECMKKGIGIGIVETENQIKNGNTSIRNKVLKKSKKGKKYCGTQTQIPEGYRKRGDRYSCLKKGYGVGMMITKEKYFPSNHN